MKYYYDCEFIEHPSFGIDLISLGMVADDGREYYAQNEECHFRRASAWVRANVYPHLLEFDLRRRKPIFSAYSAPSRRFVWQTRQQIADALVRFCDPDRYGAPEFWGWCSGYDWVVLCQLFGTMMELPSGYPHYIRDIQHVLDERGMSDDLLPEPESQAHHALVDARHIQKIWQMLFI